MPSPVTIQQSTAAPDKPEFGDRSFYGVKMQYEPHLCPQNYASQAINLRFNKGVPEPRKGVVFLPWMNRLLVCTGTVTRSSSTVTFTTSGGAVHGFSQGESVIVSGFASGYNGTYVLTAVTPTTFQYTIAGTPTTPDPAIGGAILSGVKPWGTVYGLGNYRDPLTHVEYVLIAADGNVYYTSAGNVPQTLALPGNVTITAACRFVQAFNVVLLLRGPDFPVLQMSSIASGFADVVQTPSGDVIDGTFTIPNTKRAISENNRVFAIQGDVVLCSDILDYTRYSIFDEFLINEGSQDRLQNIGFFGKSTLICGKDLSMYRVDNAYGNLASAVLNPVTRRYGLDAPDTMVDMGTDFVWLSKKGVASLTLTTQNEVQASQGAAAGKWPMFSDDIRPLIERINWQYAANSWAAFNDGKLYIAVPLDDAEIVKEEMVGRSGLYDTGTGLFVVNGLVIGATYRWKKGWSHDTSLTYGTTTLTSPGDFVATATSVTLAGTLGFLVESSLKRVLKGVNNAVLVFDTQSGPGGAWAGYDEGEEINIKQFFIATYLGRQRLFFMDALGWVKVYEEDYEDQLARPYTDLFVKEIPNWGVDTLQVNGGSLVTAANAGSNVGLNWGVLDMPTGRLNLQPYAGSASTGGYGINSSAPWTAPNTEVVLIADPDVPDISNGGGLRFYSTNGAIPTVTTTGTWPTVIQYSTAPIAITFVSREYGLTDLGMQDFLRLYLDLSTWNATFSVDLLGPGINNTVSLVSNKTYDRTIFDRPFDAGPYDETNSAGNFSDPFRQDYAIVPTGSGFGFTPSSGVVGNLHQERREPFHFRLRGRGAQVKVTSSVGRVRIKAIRFTSRSEEEKGTPYV